MALQINWLRKSRLFKNMLLNIFSFVRYKKTLEVLKLNKEYFYIYQYK
jgi:hypothetical protein